MSVVLIIKERGNSWAGRPPRASIHETRTEAKAKLVEYVRHICEVSVVGPFEIFHSALAWAKSEGGSRDNRRMGNGRWSRASRKGSPGTISAVLRIAELWCRSMWDSQRTAIVMLLAGWACVAWFWGHVPSPGVAVAILATVAAIMSIRDTPYTQKWIWVLLMFGFLWLEIRAINKDRADTQDAHARNEAKMRDGFSKILTNQQNSFAGILSNNQQQFQATMESTQALTGLAKESLNDLLGADSFPYIQPEVYGGDESIPLVIWDNGKHTLSSVTVIIRRLEDYGRNMFNVPIIEVGALHPGWPKPLKEHLNPVPDSKGIATYLIEMHTQSDVFNELINVRRSTNPAYKLPWAVQFWVSKLVLGKKVLEKMTAGVDMKKFKLPRDLGSMNVPIFKRDQWTDDIPKK